MRRNRHWLPLLLALALPAPAAAQSPAAQTVLSPGDAVRVTVWRQPELSGEFAIAADGSIQHPLYHEVRVAGVPLPEVETRLRAFLGRLESNPQFVVEPLLRISVAGEVGSPDLYTLRPEVTVAQAVVAAGGVRERGRWDRVRLLRDGREHLVDLTDTSAGSLAQSPVRSGDQIIVERREDFFRDVLVPSASVTAAVVGILNLLVR